MAILKSTNINDTGYLALPVGTTAQRIGTAAGTLVYFTSLGTTSWTVPANVDTVEVLAVGGGGGGGSDMGAGGGAGGVIYTPVYPVTPGGSVSVTVGAGGTGAPAGVGQVRGSNGGNTSFGAITAYGGGGGASCHDRSTSPAGDGASGGGASGGRGGNPDWLGTGSGYGGGNRGRSIYPDQGHDGSWASPVGTWYPGGGGGAGGPGESGSQGGNGGIGVLNDITGTQLYWGGGGGASGYQGRGGDGGNGGGGGGAVGTTYGAVGYNRGSNGGGGGTSTWANTPGGNAGSNTGGGGGGGAHYNSNNYGGNGGSGIIVVKYNTTAAINETASGALRINSSTGSAEYYSNGGEWVSMALPFKERYIITFSYMAGGYKDSTAWNNVNRCTHAVDTTINLGDNSLERSFNYQWGGCSKHVHFIFGAGNGHAVASNYIIGFNMRTEQQYAGSFGRTLTGDRSNDGGTYQETNYAWISGGSALNKFNFNTEVVSTSAAGLPAGSTTNMWGMSWENEGLFYWENDSRLWNFATETYSSWSGTQPSNHHQQKSIPSKLNYCWAGNEGSYNAGSNFRRTNFITRQTAGTYAKPLGNMGEENYTSGQDHAYCLGEYDGLQNNNSFRWNFYTETGPVGGASMQPKGHAGSSSGSCGWRDN